MRGDKGISVVVFFVIGLILIIYPLPTVVLDLMFAINLALSFIILLLSVYVDNPIKFSSYPSLLLFMVYLHLSLIVASVRSILATGSAGALSDLFGRLILGGTGNFVIGLAVFIVIVVIQYMVITNGQQRIAEVAARFTLDAMPGKQMSIDADVSAGFITPEEARKRRKALEQESAFFGAMDGASRFVKGEVLGAVLAALVSSLGGVAVGMLKGMDAGTAFEQYFSMSVGFVIQITLSSLLISMSAGLLVTRVSKDVGISSLVVDELTSYPKIMEYAAYAFAILAFIPGMGGFSTRLVFILLAGALYWLASYFRKETVPVLETETSEGGEIGAGVGVTGVEGVAPGGAPEEALGTMESMMALVGVDPFELEFGYGLLPLFDIEQGGDLLSRISLLRRNITGEIGFPVPPVRVHDSYVLGANEYVIKVRGVEEGKGEVYTDRFLAMGPPDDLKLLQGIEVVEPVFGLPAKWIPSSAKFEAEAMGLTIVDASTVILTHLGEIIRRKLYEVVTRQQVKELLDYLAERYQAVVDDVLNTMGIGEVENIIRRLLMEQVPLKDMIAVLETAVDAYKVNSSMPFVIDSIRERIRKHIIEHIKADDGNVHIIVLDPNLEKMLAPVLTNENASFPPGTIMRVVKNLKDAVNDQLENGFPPVFSVSPSIRYYFFDFVNTYVSQSAFVVSYNEIRDAKFVQDKVVKLS